MPEHLKEKLKTPPLYRAELMSFADASHLTPADVRGTAIRDHEYRDCCFNLHGIYTSSGLAHLFAGTGRQASPLAAAAGPRHTLAVTALCSCGGCSTVSERGRASSVLSDSRNSSKSLSLKPYPPAIAQVGLRDRLIWTSHIEAPDVPGPQPQGNGYVEAVPVYRPNTGSL